MKPIKIVLGSYDLVPHEYHKQYLGNLSEWIISDINPREKGIEKIDARAIPYKGVSEIYASHVLEHIREDEVLSTLKHWHEVLRINGRIHINVPDMEWALDNLMRINAGEESESSVYNTQHKMMAVINGSEQTKFDTHKSWFMREKLDELMLIAGFNFVSIGKKFEAHEMGCLIATAFK